MGIDFLQRIILSCQLQKPTWVKNLKDQYPVVKMAIFTEAKGLWYTQQCRLFHFRIAKLAKIHWLLPAVSACVIMAKCLRWRAVFICWLGIDFVSAIKSQLCKMQTPNFAGVLADIKMKGADGTSTLRLWPSFMVLETPTECKSPRRAPRFEATF